jgi:hypothetical protein
MLLGVLAGGLLPSCTKNLDVTPRQSIEAGEALLTPEDVDIAMIGGYSVLGSAPLYGTNLNIIAELLDGPGQNFWLGTFTGYRQLRSRSLTATNSEALRTWSAAYSAINVANTILDALNRGIVTDADQRNTLEGEALLMRALMHFELVRLYGRPWDPAGSNNEPGRGIPIRTKASLNEVTAREKQPRNTVAEVYAQVITDMMAAAGKLPEENGTRFNKYAAYGFLARVYLQKGDFAGARDAANEVIESGQFQLNASVLAPFTNKNTSESIFEIQQNEQNNAGTANDGLATFYASLPGIGRGDLEVNEGYLDYYEPGDIRASDWYYYGAEGTARPQTLMSGKWLTFGTNIPVLRLAEMYLIRAEANLRLGTDVGDEPVNDINRIRSRANATLLNSVTLDDIIEERKRELAFEGFSIHDTKRLQESSGSLEWDSDDLVLPIPQVEIDASEGIITQNPGY